MTPAYLQNQLDQSLRNMDLECVDVYYIHNPESQLGHVSDAEFYSRLKLAFERLEQNRKQGKLAHYGVATWNGFRVAGGVERIIIRSCEWLRSRAKSVATIMDFVSFNCRSISRCPRRLTLANETLDGERLTVVDAAQRLGVTVVASASLLQGASSDPQTAIQAVRSAPGITTALIGMSRVEHVDENLGQDFQD